MPTTLFGAVVPKVRSPQPATSPGSAGDQAVRAVRREKLDQRLDAVLRGFVEGFACDGADFFVLSAASNELVLRASHRQSDTEPAERRRSLASARADIAAMAGSAIALEDDLDVAGWSVPAWCGAAVCLPVSSDQTIHGTLWLYSNQPRLFADAELQLAEVVAGRLALELEVDAWRSGGTGCDDPTPSPAVAVEPAPPQPPKVLLPKPAVVQANIRLAKPATSPLVDEWELAGWTTPKVAAAPAFYDWQTLADGRTLVAAGAMTADAYTADGWLQAARIALRAHADSSQDAGELLTHANHTLWLASPGGEGLAVAVALLDGDGEHSSLAAAGQAGIARWRAASCEWTPTNCPPLGWSERAIYTPRTANLVVRERLVLVTSGHSLPAAAAIHRMAGKLRMASPSELRTMPGKRALRAFADAAQRVGLVPGGLAMVRRR